MKQTRLYESRGDKFTTLTEEAKLRFEQKALKRKKLKDGDVFYYKVKGTNYPCRVSIIAETGKLKAYAELVPFEGY